MSEEYSIVIAAIITVGGMLLNSIATVIVNWLFRKADANEKFFYEVYPKRLALYEDIIKKLTRMEKEGRDFLESHSINFNSEIQKIIEGDMHILDILHVRIELYGSSAARIIIASLLLGMWNRCRGFDSVKSSSEYFAFLDEIKDARDRFLEFCRKEAGADFIDKKFRKVLKKTIREKLHK
jgi:hypothetical protein